MNRLETIASMVPVGSVVADVGTDHALLPVLLIEQGRSPKVYAIDNKPGPLRGAYALTKHIAQITLVLADGIQGLSSDVTTIVIAGLGGRTIVDILAVIPSHIDTIVVSAHVAMPLVRQTLTSMGFAIDAEALLEEAGTFYEVSRFIRGEAVYQEADHNLGPMLRQEKTEVWWRWLDHLIEQTQLILNQIPKQDPKALEYQARLQLYRKEQ
jgi:tRNA (adenine22-N1)-methyltransferase